MRREPVLAGLVTASLMLAVCTPSLVSQATPSCTWNQVAAAPQTGPDGVIRCLEVFDDGSGPALIAGGIFTPRMGAR